MDNKVMRQLTCWAVSEGGLGMRSQLEGLAEGLGCHNVTHKIAKRRFPWLLMPRSYTWGIFKHLSNNSSIFTPPWPDLLLTCGRDTVPISLAIRKLSGHKTFTVHTQHPRVNFKFFDMIVAPEHDHISGPNVLSSKWALHKITKAKLEQSAIEYQDMFTAYTAPYHAVLIGGNTNKYQMPINAMTHLIKKIEDIKQKVQGSILITPSYRTDTGQIAQLMENFRDDHRVYVHDLKNERNPYIAMLSIADNIFVTDDSVNMLSEACYTEKPVYILDMLGQSDFTKPKIFAKMLTKEGKARYYQGSVESWHYNAVDEIEQLSKQIKNRLLQHCQRFG